jgi:hypothetical protein
LPYQGPDPNEPITLRSARLKRWAVGIGRRERDRIRNVKPAALSAKRKPRPAVDEIANERGVQLLHERGGLFGFLTLATFTLLSAQKFPEVDLQFSWRPPHGALPYNISPTGSISFARNITLAFHLSM